MGVEEGLIDLGFSPRKAKVLAILAEHEPLTVDELVEMTGIPRPHLYTTLRELVVQGLVLKVEGKPTRYTITTDERIFEELVKERVRRLEDVLGQINGLLAGKRIGGTFYFVDGASLKRELERNLGICKVRIWLYVPNFSLLSRKAVNSIEHASGGGVDVRVATSDEVFISSPVEPPGYIRYIEPARPLLLGVLDSRIFFGYIVKMKVKGGFVSSEEEVLREYAALFEHMWVDDYAGTLYRVKARIIKPY